MSVRHQDAGSTPQAIPCNADVEPVADVARSPSKTNSPDRHSADRDIVMKPEGSEQQSTPSTLGCAFVVPYGSGVTTQEHVELLQSHCIEGQSLDLRQSHKPITTCRNSRAPA